MKARHVMSSPVITVRPDDLVGVAAELLVSHGFTSAPVMDSRGYVVGIVTEADLIRGQVAPEGRTIEQSHELRVCEVMTPSPTSMQPDADLADVATLMLDSVYRCVPILEDGRLVGVVTRRDLLRGVADRHLVSEDDWRRRVGSP